MKHLSLLPALVAAMVLAACQPPANVSSPLSEPGSVSYDERLVGTWYGISSDADEDDVGKAETGTLIVAPGRDGFLDVTGIWTASSMGSYPDEGTEDRKVSASLAWMRWTVHASVIDGETYLNAGIVDSAFLEKYADWTLGDDHPVSHPERGYWIMRAEISEDDRLTLYVLMQSRLKCLGFVPRKVTCGEGCGFKVYDLSPEKLVAAMRMFGPGVFFSKRFRFARVEGVYPPRPEKN